MTDIVEKRTKVQKNKSRRNDRYCRKKRAEARSPLTSALLIAKQKDYFSFKNSFCFKILSNTFTS